MRGSRSAGKLTDARFCAFENELAQRHAALGTNADAAARGRWVSYLNDARASAQLAGGGGSVAARRLKAGEGWAERALPGTGRAGSAGTS